MNNFMVLFFFPFLHRHWNFYSNLLIHRNICNHYAGNSWVFSAEEKRVCHHQSDWLNSLAVWEIVHGGRYLKIQTPSPTNFRISFVNIAMHHWKTKPIKQNKTKNSSCNSDRLSSLYLTIKYNFICCMTGAFTVFFITHNDFIRQRLLY